MNARLGRACVALFALSTAFPLTASLLGDNRTPPWLGTMDVAFAAILFVSATWLRCAHERSSPTAIASRVPHESGRVRHGTATARGVLHRRRAGRWDVLVIGLAWRGWLLLYTLPFLIAALEGDQGR